ncbi:hypothetical protein AAFF_G00422700 [Aldrovandia affinis]|uniref:Uncharacterized protein n=1 Tax=Aldrovandia affinis TaxID=143900 RepID=A0AAD7X008_9TELE|nr:hypothetical protein AAFF_G00422700 [Aldrovandia affinis]
MSKSSFGEQTEKGADLPPFGFGSAAERAGLHAVRRGAARAFRGVQLQVRQRSGVPAAAGETKARAVRLAPPAGLPDKGQHSAQRLQRHACAFRSPCALLAKTAAWRAALCAEIVRRLGYDHSLLFQVVAVQVVEELRASCDGTADFQQGQYFQC